MRCRWVYGLMVSFLLAGVLGCGSGGGSSGSDDTRASGSASLVGRVVDVGPRSSARVLKNEGDEGCPEISVEVNGSAADVEFGDDCSLFVVPNMPVGDVTISIEIVGIKSTIELPNVVEGELIEIEAQADDDSLAVFVLRRAEPAMEDELPDVVEADGVEIHLDAGEYDQGLIVNGDRFVLMGEAGNGCSDKAGWTVITREVVLNGDHAIIENVFFGDGVKVRGNDVVFHNVCLGGTLVVVGDDSSVPDDDEPVECEDLHVTIDFEELEPGDSVEGLEALLPLIIETDGEARVVAAGVEDSGDLLAYFAPNDEEDERTANGCLGSFDGPASVKGQGFAVFPTERAHDIRFRFAHERTVRWFAVRMVDFGDDLTPSTCDPGDPLVRMVAFDSHGNPISADELKCPGLGSRDLNLSGDACEAHNGEPGNLELAVEAPGISEVEIRFNDDVTDSRIAFDHVRYELEKEVEIDVIPTINPDSNGVIPVAILGEGECFDVRWIDLGTVAFGPWEAFSAHDRLHGIESAGSSDFCDDHFCDRDGDGDADVILHFPTSESGITSGDEEACLHGAARTDSDDTKFHFWGCDSIRTVPNKPQGSEDGDDQEEMGKPDKVKDKDKKK